MFCAPNNILFNNIETINEEVLQTSNGVMKRTLNPITTGTSVLGVVYDGGVIIAADTLGSYGSLARFRDCTRVMAVNKSTILGCGGDYADYQHLAKTIEQKVIDEDCLNDGFSTKPKAFYNWLTRILYNRRSKFNPLWTSFVIGGLEGETPFLASVDKLGTAFEAPTIATGYGGHIAQPLFRDALEKKMGEKFTYEEARSLIVKCLTVLFYRDARSFDKYHLAISDKDGTRIEGPHQIETDWQISLYERVQY